MADPPKSLFETRDEDLDTEKQWITHYDDSPLMRLEADLIFAATLRGLTPSAIYEMELWQLASALGLHRVETRAERDNREIVDAKSEYWEETREDRMSRLAGYSERRRRRARERRQEQKAQREGKATE